jgi:hypothetical protein
MAVPMRYPIVTAIALLVAVWILVLGFRSTVRLEFPPRVRDIVILQLTNLICSPSTPSQNLSRKSASRRSPKFTMTYPAESV